MCFATYLSFDIDRADNLNQALSDARRLAAFTVERYKLEEDDLLVFFSGSKGFHLELPTATWQAQPSTVFHRVARRFAETVADAAGVRIDPSIYGKVQPFRAPNSRHPKTGLHKRRLAFDELLNLSLPGVLNLAAHPTPFDLPKPTYICQQAQLDWAHAEAGVEHETRSQKTARPEHGRTRLGRLTVDFIRNGAPQGERNRRLFSAAANLTELCTPPDVIFALLEEPALNSGLPPSEVRLTIENGIKQGRSGGAG